jgi:hypothetical protein
MFSEGRPDFIGYAVSLDLAPQTRRLTAARVQHGHADERWLELVA